MSWTSPDWVRLSDVEYSKLLQKKAVAVTRRYKKRGGTYSVREAIEAIDEAFHRCNGFDPYDGSKLNPKLLGKYDNKASKEKGAAYKREMAMLPTVDHVKAEPLPDFEIVSWQTNDAKGDMPPKEFNDFCRRVVEIAVQH